MKSKILIAEDDPEIRRTLTDILRVNGYETLTAPSGKAVEEALVSEAPAVALVDLRLPDMSGLDVIKILKTRSPMTECIVLTGYASQETAIEAVNLGAYSYIQKPFDVDYLLVTVMRAAETHQSRKALFEKNRELEQALEELKCSQDQIIRQERLNALGQMVSGIVHDFNNVLMPIVGLAELLTTDDGVLVDAEEVQDIVQSIRGAAGDAREIIRRLREFYQPDEDLHLTPTELAPIVARVVELTEPAWKTQRQAGGKVVRLIVETDDAPLVMADEPRLKEALTNIVLNAVDAMPQGGDIRIRSATDGPWGLVEVRDTGVGMHADVLKRCLEPFFSTKGQHATGFGLAMCHGIVERHGGRLDIESRPAEGTTVTVRLPLVRTDADTPDTAHAEPPTLARRLSVLVIDDDARSREIVRRFLERDGHEATLVTNGPDGVEALRKHRFDVVVTDRAMPGMNGDQFAREARRLTPDTPILLLTGVGDVMHHHGILPPGIDEVLPKPLTPKEFRAALDRAIARPRRTGTGEPEPLAPGLASDSERRPDDHGGCR